MAGSEVLFTSKGDGLQPYSKLEKLARAVCYIETTSIDLEKGHQEIRRGSGFYCKLTVKGSVLYGLITNNHVLKSQDACKDGNATFLYEGPGTGVKVQLRPEKLFRTHPKPLDYTFVGISHDDIVEKIPDLQPIEMETEPEPAKGDQIIIFQHPQARAKEFSADKILDVKTPFVQYRADTDDGSSGSPVVTTTGLKLIAVHHGGKAESYNRGTLCSEILTHLRTGTWAPPAETPTDEVLQPLSQEITPFWKDLGRRLKVPNKRIDEIHVDNIQYLGVKEKAFQMLMAWKEQRSDVAKITELSRALKALGKNRTEMKYCSGSSFMDDTAI
ncbi:PREDICTED: uncharacterized protein LOC107341661 [Acropora digitifera]|uniref:uncharacterized protein LOC107341661 n=1 Tax=Acropora digitifera TaxID=70779 RepID=UPI00077A7526|nr:PREDICTED: uncharacterized protein LOC107341661 [Acropora digitifera]